jgi:hypothetical protein
VLIELPLHDLRSLAHFIVRRAPYPVEMVLAEVAGHLGGPVAYRRATRRARRLGRSPPLATIPGERRISGSGEREPADGIASVRAAVSRTLRPAEPPLGS